MNAHLAVLAGAILSAPIARVLAQTSAPDTVRLGSLQSSALQRDPRTRELALLSTQSRLRRASFDAERRPMLSFETQAQYQSDVARIPITLPGGLTPPVPPHDTYDARLIAQQRIIDPGLGPRRAVEDAQLAESQARVKTTLFSLRQAVSDVFFASLRAQTQMAELSTTVTDLEAQLRVALARVREGTALPSEELALRAELLRRRQAVAEWRASRRASLDVLSDLTGQRIDSAATLDSPDLGPIVAATRSDLSSLRARPEYEHFSRSREVLARQELSRAAQDKPRVFAFGRAGYGRPGLNPLSDRFDQYWLAGVQLQWAPWTWGITDRDREVLSLQRQIVTAEEQAFTEAIRRGVTNDLASIDRLAAALADDDEIVVLRERIATETQRRFAEGVVTSAEYVDRQTDVLSARSARAMHRVELAQARAHFLITLGIEVR